MESSDEDNIIDNNEDDYGEFIIQNENPVKERKEINKNNLELINKNKNLVTEQDELLIKNSKNNEIKEKNIFNNEIKNEKVKRNNLIIVNKVIDLNINQNRNKKFFQDLNLPNNEENEDNSNDMLTEEKQKNNDNNNKEIEDKEDDNDIKSNIEIFGNEKRKRKIYEETRQEEIDYLQNEDNKISENSQNKYKENIENNKEESLKEIKNANEKESNLKNNKEEFLKDENNEKDEGKQGFKEIKNIITKNKEKNEQNIETNEKNNEIDKNQMLLDEKGDINRNNIFKENDRNFGNNIIKKFNLIKNEEHFEKNTDKVNIKTEQNNKDEAGYIKKDNYEKDLEESIFIKDRIESDKNYNIQTSEKQKDKIFNNINVSEFNDGKSIDLNQLNQNSTIENKNNITKSRNKIESKFKNFLNDYDFDDKTKKDLINERNNFAETNKTKKENQQNESMKNNNLVKFNINEDIINKKDSFISTSSFYNLLNNKSFRKFLNNKLEQSKKTEDEIPKKFIENLSLKPEPINISQDKKQNIINETMSSMNYSIFYNEDNIQVPLYNRNIRKTYNEKYISLKMDNTKINSNNRYSIEISGPQYDNFNDSISKIEPRRFTTIGYSNYNGNISELTLKNQKLHDKILELQNEIRVSKNEMNMKNLELEKYFSSYDKMTLENNLNKGKIDELKKELKFQKGQMNEKINKISELETINLNLKNEMNKLQKNYEAETTINKETKQNYDLIKSNYNDIKNQYDLLNIKYQTLTDENFNFKRDKALYEKQIKTKNKMIETLIENKSNILNNNKLYKLDLPEEKEESNHEMFLDYLKNKAIEFPNKEEKDNGMKIIKNYENKNGSEDYKEDIDFTKFDELTYPELQSKRDEFVTERKNLNNILNKIPIKINYKGQLEKRNELEKKLNEINRDLAIIKFRMKNLKN